MKLFKSLRTMHLRSKVLVTTLALGAVIGIPLATNAGFFPGRPTFDYNKVGTGDCHDPSNPGTQNGRCGSMNGPVFNSFVNTPEYGDERYFVDGYRTDLGDPGTADTVTDVTEGSKQVVIRMYVHNNANQTTNASGVGVAHNTKVSIELPTNSDDALQAVGAISASNATPAEVSDTVYMTGSRNFKVQYVPGSAKLYRGNTQTTPLSDSIVSGGALIGDQTMNGDLPGCFDHAALVEITVNIIPEESHDLQLLKEVRKVGAGSDWHKEVGVKPGEETQWLLTTKNVGLDQLTNVQVRDILPPHVQLVPGTVQIINGNQQTFNQPDAPLFGNGEGLGVYPSGHGRFVMFKTKALDDFNGCSIRVRNIAKAKSTQTPTEVQDIADVIITKENCSPPPAYSCDMLTATPGANRTVTFTTKATATNGATITQYQYNFGDGTPVLNTDKTSVQHTYAKDGQYATSVKVQFKVGNEVKFAEGPQCAAAVTFTTPGTPPTVTPSKPTTLPNTGAGAVAALFGATTIFGALAHRWSLGRKLGQ